jgi:hypothetical protein
MLPLLNPPPQRRHSQPDARHAQRGGQRLTPGAGGWAGPPWEGSRHGGRVRPSVALVCLSTGLAHTLPHPTPSAAAVLHGLHIHVRHQSPRLFSHIAGGMLGRAGEGSEGSRTAPVGCRGGQRGESGLAVARIACAPSALMLLGPLSPQPLCKSGRTGCRTRRRSRRARRARRAWRLSLRLPPRPVAPRPRRRRCCSASRLASLASTRPRRAWGAGVWG